MVVGLVAAVLARALKLSDEDATFYAGVAWAALSLVVTQVGRYVQAKHLAAVPVVVTPEPTPVVVEPVEPAKPKRVRARKVVE